MRFVIISLTKLTREQSMVYRRIRDLREDRDLTQKEVADVLGISQSYISRLEKRIIRRLREEMSRAE